MASKNNWQMDLSEYIRQGEPSQKEKSEAWMTAIGLILQKIISKVKYRLTKQRKDFSVITRSGRNEIR